MHNLEKVYLDAKRGRVAALGGVSFQCQAGRVFGLLGPNGAGKTTTLRILATLIQPSGGRAVVNGFDVGEAPRDVRQSLGFLSASPGLYERTTARELLRFFGELFGLPKAQLDARVAELATLLAMEDFLDSPCGKLSSGQRQKVSIARTIVHDPAVLIFDEPTANLDVLVARDVLRFVEAERERGKVILFSTHVMSEVDRLCDDVAIIHRGQVLANGTKEEIAGESSVEEVFFKTLEAHDREQGTIL